MQALVDAQAGETRGCIQPPKRLYPSLFSVADELEENSEEDHAYVG
jgi:hypothetical protein